MKSNDATNGYSMKFPKSTLNDTDLQAKVTKAITASRLALLKKKDKLIIDAINYSMGTSNWKDEEIKDRAELIQSSNNFELFSFDGKELIVFHPEETINTSTPLESGFKLEQKYKLFY